jgi:hypothetical protein
MKHTQQGHGADALVTVNERPVSPFLTVVVTFTYCPTTIL